MSYSRSTRLRCSCLKTIFLNLNVSIFAWIYCVLFQWQNETKQYGNWVGFFPRAVRNWLHSRGQILSIFINVTLLYIVIYHVTKGGRIWFFLRLAQSLQQQPFDPSLDENNSFGNVYAYIFRFVLWYFSANSFSTLYVSNEYKLQ